MASAVAHALIGGAIGLLAALGSTRGLLSARVETTSLDGAKQFNRRLFWLCAASATLPDFDVVMHLFVPYFHSFGHRGALHSPAFYLLVSAAGAQTRWFAGRRWRAFLALLLSLLSHSLLDMLTDGGLGVAILWPVSDSRHFFTYRPIPVSPLSAAAFFSEKGVRILSAELPFALTIFVFAWLTSTARKKEHVTSDDPGDDEYLSSVEGAARDGDGGARDSAARKGDGAARDGAARKGDGAARKGDSAARKGDGAARDGDSAARKGDGETDPATHNGDDVVVLEIDEFIDLHAFAPRDILNVVESYLEAAQEKGFSEVRLIHGRGKGVQRARIRKLLERHPEVLRYQDAPHTRGGWGATLVWLAQRDSQ